MDPLIAVAGQHLAPGKVRAWREDSVGVPMTYVRALHRAGAREGILAPEPVDDGAAARRLGSFGGLLLVGGADVDPALYGEEPHPESYGMDREADEFEVALARAAIRRGMPVLAICRGMQVLNVALGGTLDQHITGRDGLIGHGIPGVEPQPHDVRLQPGSWTAKAAATDVVTECSSSHHQALARLGDGLRPVGWAPDGLVEAVEAPDAGWVVAVQWHPERTADRSPAHQGLFDALVEQAASR